MTNVHVQAALRKRVEAGQLTEREAKRQSRGIANRARKSAAWGEVFRVRWVKMIEEAEAEGNATKLAYAQQMLAAADAEIARKRALTGE